MHVSIFTFTCEIFPKYVRYGTNWLRAFLRPSKGFPGKIAFRHKAPTFRPACGGDPTRAPGRPQFPEIPYDLASVTPNKAARRNMMYQKGCNHQQDAGGTRDTPTGAGIWSEQVANMEPQGRGHRRRHRGHPHWCTHMGRTSSQYGAP